MGAVCSGLLIRIATNGEEGKSRLRWESRVSSPKFRGMRSVGLVGCEFQFLS
jgi:hypothetical protein